MKILDPTTWFGEFGNSNHLLFGLLMAYVASWIYEIIYSEHSKNNKDKKHTSRDTVQTIVKNNYE